MKKLVLAAALVLGLSTLPTEAATVTPQGGTFVKVRANCNMNNMECRRKFCNEHSDSGLCAMPAYKWGHMHKWHHKHHHKHMHKKMMNDDKMMMKDDKMMDKQGIRERM